MQSHNKLFHTITFPVQGMSCGSCIRHIKAALEPINGVKSVEVNLAAAEVTITYNQDSLAPRILSSAIRNSGYLPGTPTQEQSQ